MAVRQVGQASRDRMFRSLGRGGSQRDRGSGHALRPSNRQGLGASGAGTRSSTCASRRCPSAMSSSRKRSASSASVTHSVRAMAARHSPIPAPTASTCPRRRTLLPGNATSVMRVTKPSGALTSRVATRFVSSIRATSGVRARSSASQASTRGSREARQRRTLKVEPVGSWRSSQLAPSRAGPPGSSQLRASGRASLRPWGLERSTPQPRSSSLGPSTRGLGLPGGAAGGAGLGPAQAQAPANSAQARIERGRRHRAKASAGKLSARIFKGLGAKICS